MGREIRRVPPNWEHPRWTKDDAMSRSDIGEYKSMYDQSYKDAAEEWLRELERWEPEWGCKYYWESQSPPDVESHRPAFDTEPTWFQAYQTVSEGTPVSPPFATGEELVEYLATYGDFWDQSRGDGPWSRESAEAFVLRGGWVPSMMVTPNGYVQAKDIAGVLDDK